MLGVTAVGVGTIAVLGMLARLQLIGDGGWPGDADSDVRQVLGNVGLYPLWTLLVSFVWMLASVAVTAVGSVVTHRSLDGARTSTGRAWRSARPRLPAAFGLGVLDVVVIAAPLILAGALSILVAVQIGPAHARSVAAVFFAIALLVVLATLPALVIAGPMLVIEALRPVEALSRGFALAVRRRCYGRLLARVLCTYLIVMMVMTLVGALTGLAGHAFDHRVDGVGVQSLPGLLIATAGWVIGQIVALPFLIATNAVLYDEQRERAEKWSR